jgi:hypothetical protein
MNEILASIANRAKGKVMVQYQTVKRLENELLNVIQQFHRSTLANIAEKLFPARRDLP